MDTTYILGHADAETRRLLLQAKMYDGYTEHALRVAGLRPGMRVLDIGCGPGDVSFIASRLVGPTGMVLGIDASAEIVELARARAAELTVHGVLFEQSTIADITLDQPVDAVIGRLILMHLPDAASALRDLAAHVRPGGIIAFSEIDVTAARTIPAQPLYQAMIDAICKTFAGMGVDPAFATRVHVLFRQAGLNAVQLTSGAPLGRADDTEFLTCAVESWRSVYQMAERLGLVTDELAEPDTLLPPLRDEVANADAIVMLPTLISAWTTV